MESKILSVVIPTRNRQKYAKFAVASVLSSKRSDLEVIVLDNSDDHCLIEKELSALLGDERLKLIRSTSETFSMSANWNRALPFIDGRWVVFIGDDDALFDDLPDFLNILEQDPHFDFELIGWDKLIYVWPDNPNFGGSVRPISLSNQIFSHSSEEFLTSLFQWNSSYSVNPGGGVGVYHAAVKRELLETMKDSAGNVFTFYTPDYENGYRCLQNTEKFLWIKRPFSILGACKESNSGALANEVEWSNAIKKIEREGGFDIPNTGSFISPSLTLTSWILNFQLRFIEYFQSTLKINLANFVSKLNQEFEESKYLTNEKLLLIKQILNSKDCPLYEWRERFNPIRKKNLSSFRGLHGDTLYVEDSTRLGRSVLEYRDLLQVFLPPIMSIGRAAS